MHTTFDQRKFLIWCYKRDLIKNSMSFIITALGARNQHNVFQWIQNFARKPRVGKFYFEKAHNSCKYFRVIHLYGKVFYATDCLKIKCFNQLFFMTVFKVFRVYERNGLKFLARRKSSLFLIIKYSCL